VWDNNKFLKNILSTSVKTHEVHYIYRIIYICSQLDNVSGEKGWLGHMFTEDNSIVVSLRAIIVNKEIITTQEITTVTCRYF
jgi:hypothetical protein